nr:hypothetical protein [uncultured Campylobacter sp.]
MTTFKVYACVSIGMLLLVFNGLKAYNLLESTGKFDVVGWLIAAVGAAILLYGFYIRYKQFYK